MSPLRDGNASVLNVITGPTAAGKSAIAMQLARQFNLSIISADSRQVYRGFDIGTAKPSRAEQEEVPHFGIDVMDPEQRYSAHAWANDAGEWMEQARGRRQPPIVVGGTGFYVRALVRPLAPAPALDVSRRTQLEQWLSQQPLSTLQVWCARLDPIRAHLGRSQLSRAIETALLSGTRLGDAHEAHAAAAREQALAELPLRAAAPAVRYLVVDPGLPLAERIQQRVTAMMENGWLEETRSLMNRVPSTAPAWLASGYDVMRQHVNGQLNFAQAVERIVIETRQYAKRQRTWCRHQLTEGPVTRISPSDPHAIDRAIHWLNEAESIA